MAGAQGAGEGGRPALALVGLRAPRPAPASSFPRTLHTCQLANWGDGAVFPVATSYPSNDRAPHYSGREVAGFGLRRKIFSKRCSILLRLALLLLRVRLGLRLAGMFFQFAQLQLDL